MNWTHAMARALALLVAIFFYIGWAFGGSEGFVGVSQLAVVAAALAVALASDRFVSGGATRAAWIAVVATGVAGSMVSIWAGYFRMESPDTMGMFMDGFGALCLLLGFARLTGIPSKPSDD